ncbi:hypothetical protein JAAARDRAFT_205925 [Jaapia argillacea MUCL 33604]|uniref:F-box domain-containing protein n=1 Tax=Jaapia argillacea MUCL 33604 TaxID=933084 RepID=A0A067PYI6_9AGAM|nr:hypothetical protein JAAARDRAFT_205925 [Jaapia argillacea MUCL 33604]
MSAEASLAAPRVPQLPVELYDLILSFVQDKSDLCRLCLASRVLQQRATPFLYSIVHISDHPQAWCATVNSNPHIAGMVHTVAIVYSRSWILGDFQRICGALNRVVNLRDLAVSDPLGRAGLTADDYLTLLRQSTFRLRRFQVYVHHFGGYVERELALSILESQPQLCELSFMISIITDPHLPLLTIPSHLAPRLISLELNDDISLKAFASPRPLLRLRQRMVRHGDCIDHLYTLSTSLQSYALHRDWDGYDRTAIPAETVVRRIASQLPDLLFLSIVDDALASYGVYDPQDLYNFLLTFSPFRKLHTLVLDVANRRSPQRRTETDCLQVAKLLMQICPSLRRVAMAVWGPSSCYVRTPNGVVEDLTAAKYLLHPEYWRFVPLT